MSVRIATRRIRSGFFTGLVVLLCFLAVLPLFLIFADLVHKGASSINWDFFVKIPVPAGQSGGGVSNAIAGTIIIVLIACVIGIPIGIGTGLYLAEYGIGRLGWFVRFLADVLNGTPSIVVGIFAWTWFVKPVHHFSALAGGAALALLMVPMLARTTEEMLRLVPNSLREAALALGYPRWRTSLSVMARVALSGIVTGSLVGVARVAGETAPLLFTALGNINFDTNIKEPMQTLSLQIFTYATGPFEDWHRLAWASALVLMSLVLSLALAARWATRKRYGT
ncbi:MAG TPA: phosphate ABC transporter permease PstA [Gemmatimonadales bacterium]|nr:phosphate ABC transporter permease PstA [Gemmatimonadales bacterium]